MNEINVTMKGIDIRPAASKVVEVLSKNKIPLDLIQAVFQESMRLINHNTVPYSPSLLQTMEEAMRKAPDTLPDGLISACMPAMEYLKKNCTPHDSLVITDEQFRLVNDTVDSGPIECE